MLILTYRSMQFATDHHLYHGLFIIIKGLASLQARLCALVRVICRHIDQNAAVIL